VKLDDAKRTRLIIDISGAALCLVATGMFYVIALGPILDELKQAAASRAELDAQRAASQSLTRTLARDQAAYRAAQHELAQSPLQLAPVTDINKRLLDVTALARDCGLKLDIVLPGTATTGQRYETVPIHLSGTGNYGTCVDLLHKLRQKFPDTTVASLDLSADPADTKAAARFTIDLLWHAASTTASPGR